MSNTGRSGAETSAKRGVLFSEDAAELTGRELGCIMGLCMDADYGTVLCLQTEYTENRSFKAEKTP